MPALVVKDIKFTEASFGKDDLLFPGMLMGRKRGLSNEDPVARRTVTKNAS